MHIKFHKKFRKKYEKLPKHLKLHVDRRIQLFLMNRPHPTLRHHRLSGNMQDYWSIDITGDYRALYREFSYQIIRFEYLGTHSELFG